MCEERSSMHAATCDRVVLVCPSGEKFDVEGGGVAKGGGGGEESEQREQSYKALQIW